MPVVIERAATLIARRGQKKREEALKAAGAWGQMLDTRQSAWQIAALAANKAGQARDMAVDEADKGL